MTGSRRGLDLMRGVLVVVIVAFVTWALWRNWAAVSEQLSRMSWPVLLGAFAFTVITPVLSMFGWRVLLADLGTHLPAAPASSVFFVGQLAKYIPGSVWTVLAQAEMGARLQVPRRRMAVVGLLTIGLAVVTGFVLGVPAIPRLVAGEPGAFSWWWVLIAIVLGSVLLWPRVLNPLIRRGLQVMRREPLEHDLHARAILAASAWLVGAWIAVGLSVAILARPVAPDSTLGDLLVSCVCGFALASAAGMISILVPAGVGVRDGLLGLLLVSFMPAAAAAAVVVVSRFLTVVADLFLAGFGWAWGRRHRLLGSAG